MRKMFLALAGALTLSLTPAHATCLKHVFVFDAYWCDVCKLVKAFLYRHNIPFDSADVTLNPNYQLTLRVNFGHTGIPVTVIAGDWDHATLLLKSGWVIHGFNEPELRRLLCIDD